MKLVVLQGTKAGAELLLEGREVFAVGSAPDADLSLADPGVLPNHARIFKDESRIILMDVSGRGVRVNGKTEIQAELKAGDELALGEVVLRVAPKGVPASAVLAKPAVPDGAAELRVLKGPDEGKVYTVTQRSILGRGVNADVALLDMKCSREHCAVEKRTDGFYLVDLGSTNGTRLNEIKLETKGSVLLKPGDKLRLGATVIEFRAGAKSVARSAPTTVMATEKDVVFEIDIDRADETPRVVPVADESTRRHATTTRMAGGSALLRRPDGAALQGELEKMGFAQVVQFLNFSHKNGELVIAGPTGELCIHFKEGEVYDCWGLPDTASALECFQRIARLRSGHFEFHERVPPRERKIHQSTMALLMEAMRLVDEATDPGD